MSGNNRQRCRLHILLLTLDGAVASFLLVICAFCLIVTTLTCPITRLIWRLRTKPSTNGLPNRLLIIGYTTIEQAKTRGLSADYNNWYNPGGTFERVFVLILNARVGKRVPLNSEIMYRQLAIPFALRLGALRYSRFLFSCIYGGGTASYIVVSERVHALQVNGPNLASFTAAWVKLSTGIPTVMFIEAFWESILDQQEYLPRLTRFLLPFWYRLTYRIFDGYVGAPSLNKKLYEKRGMREERIFPYRHPIDVCQIISMAQSTAIESNIHSIPRPWVISVGRLHSEKQPEDIVRMAAALRDQGRLCSTILIGGGDMKEELRSLARKLDVLNQVHFLGALPQKQTVALMAACDCYFAPYHGSALIEAVATACPIVAYDNNVHSLFITDRRIVSFTPDRDPRAAAAAVGALLSRPEEARALGKAAQEWALERYSARAISESWYRPFQEVFANKRQ